MIGTVYYYHNIIVIISVIIINISSSRSSRIVTITTTIKIIVIIIIDGFIDSFIGYDEPTVHLKNLVTCGSSDLTIFTIVIFFLKNKTKTTSKSKKSPATYVGTERDTDGNAPSVKCFQSDPVFTLTDRENPSERDPAVI